MCLAISQTKGLHNQLYIVFGELCSRIDWVCDTDLKLSVLVHHWYLSKAKVLEREGMFYGVAIEPEVNAACICSVHLQMKRENWPCRNIPLC